MSLTTDPRAGKLCANCNALRPDVSKKHCASPTCDWWKCTRCGASNDRSGLNSATSSTGQDKTGRGAA